MRKYCAESAAWVDCATLHSGHVEEPFLDTNERIEAERAADNKADVKAVLVIFLAVLGMALHFISGWTPLA